MRQRLARLLVRAEIVPNLAERESGKRRQLPRRSSRSERRRDLQAGELAEIDPRVQNHLLAPLKVRHGSRRHVDRTRDVAVDRRAGSAVKLLRGDGARHASRRKLRGVKLRSARLGVVVTDERIDRLDLVGTDHRIVTLNDDRTVLASHLSLAGDAQRCLELLRRHLALVGNRQLSDRRGRLGGNARGDLDHRLFRLSFGLAGNLDPPANRRGNDLIRGLSGVNLAIVHEFLIVELDFAGSGER